MVNRKFNINEVLPQGSKGVLIKLQPYEEDTTTETGIVIPTYEAYTTEGGRPAAKPTLEKFSTIGIVLAISDKARELLDEEKMDLKKGDAVLIYPHAKVSSNWLILHRHTPVADFEGYLLLHPNAVQAKLDLPDAEA